MPHPIICALDGSEVAREAAHLAHDLSKRLGSPLLLVHVAHADAPPGTSVVPHGRVALLERERRDAELLLAKQAVELSLGSNVQRRVVFGNAAESLVEVARTEHADLLVLGARQRGSVSSALLGSVSRTVAGSAPCPVVIVPAGSTRTGWGREAGSTARTREG